jgi:hypothetical protein
MRMLRWYRARVRLRFHRGHPICSTPPFGFGGVFILADGLEAQKA